MATCSVEYCNSKVYGHGMCSRHYTQVRRHGKIIRGLKDGSEITYHESYAELTLTTGLKVIIDLDDVDKVKYVHWNEVRKYGFHKTLGMLHRFILNLPRSDSRIVDHIDRNTINNRKSNLRITNQRNNLLNVLRKKPLSGYYGVTESSSGNWVVRVDSKYIAVYSNIYLAAQRYNVETIKLHGSNALNLNSIPRGMLEQAMTAAKTK